MPPLRARGRRARRCLAVGALAAALLTSHLTTAPAYGQTQDQEWIRPVAGSVVRGFSEPPARFAAGHRGADFAAAPGTPVRAANDGAVVFAGDVAGSLHIVVAHDGGIRTSYSFLLRVDVAVGQQVRRGQVVGASGGTGDGHGPNVLHFGVRIGDRYVDPMLLFRPRDLTRMVRLVPASERAAAEYSTPEKEKQGIKDGSDCGGGLVGFFCDAADTVVDSAEAAGGAVVGAFETGVRLVERAGGFIADVVRKNLANLRKLLRVLREAAPQLVRLALESTPLGQLATALVRLGATVMERGFACPQPDPQPHPATLDNLVIAVGGLGSSRRRRRNGSITPSFHFDWKVLGYRKRNVEYFSYAPNSPTYRSSRTYQDLHAEARLLAAQIKEWSRLHPGHPVDLVGHSQGGVVIALFIMEIYRGHESEFPPIDHVVAFDSPLMGTPLANVADEVATLPGSGWIKDRFPIGSPAMKELEEGSPTVERLWRPAWPAQVKLLSIGGMEDPFVPTPSSAAPVGRSVVVDAGAPFVPDDHSAVLNDADALSAAQAHVHNGAPAPCGPLVGAPGTLYAAAIRLATAPLP